MEKEFIKPKTLWLTTNTNCNNRCKWCYASNSKYLNNCMKKEKIFDVIDYFAENDIKKIVLIGGEPSLYNDLEEIISYITNKKIDVSMATNGKKFADYEFANSIVSAGLKKINISIKGTTENEYLENTNTMGFVKMLSAYNNLKKLGASVTLSYVLSDISTSKIDCLIDMIKVYNLDNILFQLYKPSINESDNYNAPSIFQLAKLVEYLHEKIKNANINYKIELSIPLCCIEEKVLNDLIESDKIITCCHIRKGNGIVLDTNFNILPCNHFVNYQLNKNSIDTKNILDFWNQGDALEFRRLINTYPSTKCQKCEKWKICGGGCCLRWFNNQPDDFIKAKGGESNVSIGNC